MEYRAANTQDLFIYLFVYLFIYLYFIYSYFIYLFLFFLFIPQGFIRFIFRFLSFCFYFCRGGRKLTILPRPGYPSLSPEFSCRMLASGVARGWGGHSAPGQIKWGRKSQVGTEIKGEKEKNGEIKINGEAGSKEWKNKKNDAPKPGPKRTVFFFKTLMAT